MAAFTKDQNASGRGLTDNDGSLKEDLPPITTFLNRLLALTIHMQNLIFEVFESLLRGKIDGAMRAGVYDRGVETIVAESLFIAERRTLYNHSGSGAETQIFTIRRRDRNQPMTLDQALARATERGAALLVNAQSGRAAVRVPAPSLMLDDGEVEHRVRLLRPMERHAISNDALDQTHWESADRSAFCDAWAGEVAQVPPFTDSDMHIVTGLLLPIWKRLPKEHCRVYRLQTDSGERVIGRLVSLGWVGNEAASPAEAVDATGAWPDILEGRVSLTLQDGLHVKRVRVMSDYRVELLGFSDGLVDRMKAMGLVSEIISWKLRLFIPTTRQGLDILAKLVEGHPALSLQPKATSQDG